MLASLRLLRVRNLALVDDLTWELAPGFNAVTGETGSGKSIIVGALKLVLGERADKTLIRAGTENCTVEAVFEVADRAALNAELEERGVDLCDDDQLILRRFFTVSGTNRQSINGSPTTLAVLAALGDGLVDLHGPHDHQSLLSNLKQLDLLDAFAGAHAVRAEYSNDYRQLQRLVAEHADLSGSEAALARELDLLRHQVHEIEAAQLRADEEGELVARYTIAANGRRLAELTNQILNGLSESDDAIRTRLDQTGKLLRDLERIDGGTSSFVEMHARAVRELEEMVSQLQHYAERLDTEPQRLAQLEERVTLIETLKRKYGSSLKQVITFGSQAEERLRKIESRGAELQRLEQEIEHARTALTSRAKELRRLRTAAAPKLSGTVTAHLRELGFKKSQFEIVFTESDTPLAHGFDSIDFLFGPNPGEPAKPLKAIASSGEISRVMLAVKSALAMHDTIPVLVFDEIDVNVGGEIAHAVGAMMKVLSRGRQVLCITHLPQVAAQAEAQFVVTKDFANDRTISQIGHVHGKARVEEIARMLGGKSSSALAHARTLLGAC